MSAGGQKQLLPSTICGTPMRSSGASWLPRSETQGSPTSAANCCTRDDFPVPGGPQTKTGRRSATRSRKSGSWRWVSEMGAFMGSPRLALQHGHRFEADLQPHEIRLVLQDLPHVPIGGRRLLD